MAEIGVGHFASTSSPPTVGSTAILFFQLPSSNDVGSVYNAALTFSLNDKSGSFVTNPANADIWGVGYVASPVIDTDWYLAGNNDLRPGVNLGGNPVVKIAAQSRYGVT